MVPHFEGLAGSSSTTATVAPVLQTLQARLGVGGLLPIFNLVWEE